MEKQTTTTNIAAGGPSQPEANVEQQSQPQPQISTPENDAKLALLKPELLCVGFIGLFHNLSILVNLLLHLIYWSVAMHEVVQKTKKDGNRKQVFLCLNDADVADMLGFVLVHLVGSLLAAGALVMDVFLRTSTNPEKTRVQTTKSLQIYLILNMICLAFGLLMSLIIHTYVPSCIINSLAQNCLMLSHCLRAVCIFIVYKYLALLGSGFKYWGGGIHIPIRVHNKSPEKAQAAPANQAQKV